MHKSTFVSYSRYLSLLDEGFETKAIFLDISKVFDKAWHEGLIYKLRLYGFSGDRFFN